MHVIIMILCISLILVLLSMHSTQGLGVEFSLIHIKQKRQYRFASNYQVTGFHKKIHKNPYEYRFIEGSSKTWTKHLSILLTKLLTHIKQGLLKYCETAYSRSVVNQLRILKNSKELLEHLQSPNFNHIKSIKSIDFSTLYTTIPHQKLKSRLASFIRNSFIYKNGNRRYKLLVFVHEEPYFVIVQRIIAFIVHFLIKSWNLVHG